MKLLFFQNCLSPHQIPYIKEICHDARVEKVYLITPRTDYEMRTEMGWSSSQLLQGTSIIFYLLPSDEELKRLLQNEGVIALFSGIRADKDVFRWFKLSLGFHVKRGIITEAPLVYSKPLLFHYARFLLQDYGFVKSIHYIFAIGTLTVKYYSFWSKKWRIFPFAYCTEYGEEEMQKPFTLPDYQHAKFLFVGSVDKRKNVGIILKALHSLKGSFIFDIIGDGQERKRLEGYVTAKQIQRIAFLGKLAMQQVHEIMPQYDVLILPSRYDGWGAVVNEALQRGLFVICSDKCGAKDLLQDARCGCVFQSGNHKQLAAIIEHCCSHISEIRANKEFRREWAERCISGKVIARYMVDCLSGEKVNEPWLRKL